MKKIKPMYKFLLLFLMPLTILQAQTFTEQERHVRTYPVSPNSNIEVNNKYGKIYVKTWQKDSVKFEIDLNISSNSLTRLHKVKNSISFDFTTSRYYITAITNFGSAGNQIYTELKNLSDALIPGKNTIEINYTVYCPESVNLSLINKFGDIYIDDLRGEINVSLSNGDLKVNSISGISRIELNFGNGMINHLTDANLSVSYSDMKIKSAEKLSINSKSSTLHIDDADLLKLDSRRDKYFITRVYSIHTVANFSQLWMEEVNYDSHMNLKFGSLTIDKVRAGFSGIDIVSEYADLNLHFDADASFKADIFYHKDVVFEPPKARLITEPENEKISDTEIHTRFRTASSGELSDVKINALQKCYLNMIIN
ncbi:MAG: hypothetical protein IH594_07145 [Bacteroidales bacterium]|nr:hypothetical protein [Bacteroidales bacterium]